MKKFTSTQVTYTVHGFFVCVCVCGFFFKTGLAWQKDLNFEVILISKSVISEIRIILNKFLYK